MKSVDFAFMLGELDDGLLLEAESPSVSRPKYGARLRLAAAAACLCLIIAAVAAALIGRAGDAPEPVITGEEPGRTEPYEPIRLGLSAGSPLGFVVGTSAEIGASGVQADPRQFDFNAYKSNFVVKATFVEALPDTYCRFNSSMQHVPQEYRLIKLRAEEVFSGKGMEKAQEFYFMMPKHLLKDVDLSQYDSFFISMLQCGTEGYVLRNVTKNAAESFPAPVFDGYRPELGDFIAFTGGVFDEGLWQHKSWLYGYQFAKSHLDEIDENLHNGGEWINPLVVYRGCTEDYTRGRIMDRLGEWRGDEVSLAAKSQIKGEEARAALEYVKPFENGVFVQILSGDRQIYCRYINGCETEEEIAINVVTGEVTRSGVTYTEDDMSRMEDIPARVSALCKKYESTPPSPPNMDPDGKKLVCLAVFGWYAKKDDTVYGVVKTIFRYTAGYELEYYDEAYTLYDAASATRTELSRDALIALLGERNVYIGGELGAGVEVPVC